MPTASPSVYSTIGLKNMVIAPWLKASSYGPVQAVAGAIEISIEPSNTEPEVLYNSLSEAAVLYPETGIKFKTKMADIPLSIQKMIFGHVMDGSGVIARSVNDSPPYFAVGFKSEKSNGKYRYVWLYKVRAHPVTETYATKEGSTITRQTGEIEWTAVRGNSVYGRYQVIADEGENGFTEEMGATFLDSVYIFNDTYYTTLSSLTMEYVELSPAFNQTVYTYTALTAAPSSLIKAVAAVNSATVTIKLNGEVIENGSRATWVSGSNTLVVTVKTNYVTKTYTITVTTASVKLYSMEIQYFPSYEDVPLVPEFAADTLAYTLTSTQERLIMFTQVDDYSLGTEVVKLNGSVIETNPPTETRSYHITHLHAVVGTNILTIAVTVAGYTRTYTITITRTEEAT